MDRYGGLRCCIECRMSRCVADGDNGGGEGEGGFGDILIWCCCSVLSRLSVLVFLAEMGMGLMLGSLIGLAFPL